MIQNLGANADQAQPIQGSPWKWQANQGFKSRQAARRQAKETKDYRDPTRPRLRWRLHDITRIRSRSGGKDYWVATIQVREVDDGE